MEQQLRLGDHGHLLDVAGALHSGRVVPPAGDHGQRPDRGVVGEEHVGRPAGDGPLCLLGGNHLLLEPSPPAGVELPVPPVNGVGPAQSEKADALLGVRSAI